VIALAPAVAVHFALIASDLAVPRPPASPKLSCPTCGVAVAQAAPLEEDQKVRERERLLAVRIEELNLKIAQIDVGWPTSSLVMAYFGFGLGPLGLISGAVVAGYGYVATFTLIGAILITVGVVGVVLIVAALWNAFPRLDVARKERNRLLEERMRAEAELQYLRGMATGPRP
jgi:hypothetical protein